MIEAARSLLGVAGYGCWFCWLPDTFNAILEIAFPLLPWELWIFFPWIMAWLVDRASANPSMKPTLHHLNLFITAFAGLYGGPVHSIGFLQATDTLFFGGTGICIPLPGPSAQPAGSDVPSGPWCELMALHIYIVVPFGWYFFYMLLDARKRTGNAHHFCSRMSVWLFAAGVGQLAPYLGVLFNSPDEFGTVMTQSGLYSGVGIRGEFTFGITEFLNALSWCAGIPYFYMKAKQYGKFELWSIEMTEEANVKVAVMESVSPTGVEMAQPV